MDIKMRNYKILAFGRHSDLLNLGVSIRDGLRNHMPSEAILYSDRDLVDGQLVSDLGVFSVDPKDLAIDIFTGGRDQLIHVVAPNAWGLLCALIGRIRGNKILYHCHRFDFQSYPSLKAIEIFIYTVFIFLISDKIFVHSEKTKRFLFWKEKIIYAELPEFKFSSLPIDLFTHGTEVLFFGRLDSNKGIDLLAQIIDLLPETIFRICGELVDLSLEKKLEGLSEKNNVIVQVGRVEQDDLPGIFQTAKCTILPYSGATQSGIPFLARSLKTPVLVADVGDLAATVSDSSYGISVKTRNPAVWARVINNTDWHDLRCRISELDDKTRIDGVYLSVVKKWL